MKIERERFRREMQEAGQDEMFLADVEEARHDFAAIDAEEAGRDHRADVPCPVGPF